MKTRLSLLLFAVSLLAVIPIRAEDKAKPVDSRPVLHVTVLEALGNRAGNAFTDFDRLDLAFQHVAKERKWPVKIVSDRFAANVPDYDSEVRVSLQRVRQDTPNEFVFRGWTTLTLKGKKQDFGIIDFHYDARILENPDDILEKVFRGGVAAIADKIGPVLFPDLNAKK